MVSKTGLKILLAFGVDVGIRTELADRQLADVFRMPVVTVEHRVDQISDRVQSALVL
jgi:hypothetical protein